MQSSNANQVASRCDTEQDLQWIHRWLLTYSKLWTKYSWSDFYHDIRDESWPDCNTFQDLSNLPKGIQSEILWQHLPNLLNSSPSVVDCKLEQIASSIQQVHDLVNAPLSDYYLDTTELELTHSANCNGITIPYHPSMEAGGILRAPMFLKILDMVAPNRQFDHCLEWCSGPGFIGYSILGHGRCQTLDLADIWEPALLAAEQVIGCNPAKTWHIRRISDISDSIRYDLIVGNPPWFPGNLIRQARVVSDPGLKIHREFFQDAQRYLAPDGIIILVEGQTYTGPGDFLPLLENTGLELAQVVSSQDRHHWFAIIQHNKTAK